MFITDNVNANLRPENALTINNSDDSYVRLKNLRTCFKVHHFCHVGSLSLHIQKFIKCTL